MGYQELKDVMNNRTKTLQPRLLGHWPEDPITRFGNRKKFLDTRHPLIYYTQQIGLLGKVVVAP
jgi:hypothetical protein